MRVKENIQLRMHLVMVLLGMIPLAIAGKVLWISIGGGAPLADAGERQARTEVEVPAMRGSIYDRAGRALVVNTASYNLALDPTIQGFAQVESSFFENLSQLTGKPAAHFRRRVAERTSPQYVLLHRDLTEAQKEEIDAWEVPGALLVPVRMRRYNYNEVAAHVVGHVSNDGSGHSGIEKQYDEFLGGVPGRRAVQRDRNGNIKAYVAGKTRAPQNGETLELTLDLVLQSILEDELLAGIAATEAAWGTVVAMDPRTGGILGMANAPVYDPNRFNEFDSADRRNRAITDHVEPGSTFKLVAAVASLETGRVAIDDSIDTGESGYAVVDGRGLHDLRGYGVISYEDAIAKSSNIAIARTVSGMDRGVFFQYARNLGFGQRTYIDLPGEVPGRVKKPREWSRTTLSSMSIGYEVEATPLQILSAYSALANGGLLMQPHVVKRRLDASGQLLWEAKATPVRRAFSEAIADSLLPAFMEVVETGTAKLARIDGVSMAGKTGTARVIKNGEYQRTLHRASFVGFFPAEDPEVALLLMLAEPRKRGNSGVITAPIVKNIVRRWVSAQPQTHDVMQTLAVSETPAPLPHIEGLPAVIAEDRLRIRGYDVESVTPERAFHTVSAPVTETNRRVQMQRPVRLEIATPDSVAMMPDLTGLSLRQAIHWLHAVGMDVKIEGSGMVVGQHPEAGEPLVATAVLRCR